MKLQTPIKVSPLPPKVYGNHYFSNNTKPTHLKGESEFGMYAPTFITQHNLVTKTI